VLDQQEISELQQKGFCVLRAHLPAPLIDACREAFWPILLDYLERHRDAPNRGRIVTSFPCPSSGPASCQHSSSMPRC